MLSATRATALIVFGLVAVTATSWLYLFHMARDMDGMSHCAMMMPGGPGMGIRWLLAMWLLATGYSFTRPLVQPTLNDCALPMRGMSGLAQSIR